MSRRTEDPAERLRNWLKDQGISGGELVKMIRKLDRGLTLNPAQLSRILKRRSEPTVPQRLAIEIVTGIPATDWDAPVERRLRRRLRAEAA